MRSLTNLTIADIKSAKERKVQNLVCPEGVNVMELRKFVEEETYSQIVFAMNNVEYRFFVDLEDRATGDLRKEVLEWLQALSTKTITADTTFQSIINNAIGYSYEVKVRHYVAKKDNSTQHAIDWNTKPVLTQTASVEEVDAGEEELELPF